MEVQVLLFFDQGLARRDSDLGMGLVLGNVEETPVCT